MGVQAMPWVALVSPFENFLGIYQGKSKETQRKEITGVGNGEAKEMDGKMMPGVWIWTGEGERKRKRKRKRVEEKREQARERREGDRKPVAN